MRRLWVLLLLVSCAPKNIAKSSCQSELLATGDPWTCTISGERVEQVNAIHFTTESRNLMAKVKVALLVKKGSLRVSYVDSSGPRELVVTPQTPAAVDFETRLHRDNRSFTITFEPRGGAVQGLSGTVDYLTP